MLNLLFTRSGQRMTAVSTSVSPIEHTGFVYRTDNFELTLIVFILVFMTNDHPSSRADAQALITIGE